MAAALAVRQLRQCGDDAARVVITRVVTRVTKPHEGAIVDGRAAVHSSVIQTEF